MDFDKTDPICFDLRSSRSQPRSGCDSSVRLRSLRC
jgi:hypothetical protein